MNGARTSPHERAHFDALYASSDDPWHLRASWYEQRKRGLLLASLPESRYAWAYEPACAGGELTRSLARRCKRLLASDGSEAAVALARRRLADMGQVQVRQAWLPDEWPEGRFDLIVLSEFLYYLRPQAIAQVAQQARAALLPGGTVVACHWRAPIAGCALGGDAVHRQLRADLALPQALSCVDADFCLDLWQDQLQSVAQRDGRR
ncbi:MAG: nodulation S family protein [Burkholderiaceae bacterium]|nr:nodulation S family protein [Burkholderiaceae bacterium]